MCADPSAPHTLYVDQCSSTRWAGKDSSLRKYRTIYIYIKTSILENMRLRLYAIYSRLSSGPVHSVLHRSGARRALCGDGRCLEHPGENRWRCVLARSGSAIPVRFLPHQTVLTSNSGLKLLSLHPRSIWLIFWDTTFQPHIEIWSANLLTTYRYRYTALTLIYIDSLLMK